MQYVTSSEKIGKLDWPDEQIEIFFVVIFLDCRMVTESDAVPKRETAGGVSVVAVQYVASMSWPFSNFTDPSHFMV